MLKIIKTCISLTRGDSAYIDFDITDKCGNPIPLTAEDNIRCQVRKTANGGELLFEGVIERTNGICWHISPSDTADAAVGEYVWDAQVEFSNGDVFSIIPVSPFIILSEVTENEEEVG